MKIPTIVGIFTVYDIMLVVNYASGKMIEKNKRRKNSGAIQKKIVLLLWAGLALGLSHSPLQQWRVIKGVAQEWQRINRNSLLKSLHSLYQSNLVDLRENADGTTTIVLSKIGKRLALSYNLEKMKLKKPLRWDGKWRMAMFDIPEKYRQARDAFRGHLKQLEFFEYQKSVFITPYPCAKEVEYLREFWRVKPYVRYLVVEELDNELHLKKHFNLI